MTSTSRDLQQGQSRILVPADQIQEGFDVSKALQSVSGKANWSAMSGQSRAENGDLMLNVENPQVTEAIDALNAANIDVFQLATQRGLYEIKPMGQQEYASGHTGTTGNWGTSSSSGSSSQRAAGKSSSEQFGAASGQNRNVGSKTQTGSSGSQYDNDVTKSSGSHRPTHAD